MEELSVQKKATNLTSNITIIEFRGILLLHISTTESYAAASILPDSQLKHPATSAELSVYAQEFALSIRAMTL